MFMRNIAPSVREALADTPVVLINGARQTGKSTLAQWLISGGYPARYITLDDATMLAAAQDDPAGFLAGMDGPVVLDEIQRAPGLFLSIKADVDRHRSPGRFLLTGSANVMLLPRLSESLAGRMEILTLWPLSRGEMEGVTEGFVDSLFGDAPPLSSVTRVRREDIIDHVVVGGYPEVLARSTPERRRAWFSAYVTTILQRDVRDLAQVEGVTEMPRLLSLLAARTSSLLNFAELGRTAGIPQTTLKRYMSLLEATFLVQALPAWSGNLGKRLVKSPRLMLCDTGLTAHLLGLNAERLAADPQPLGPLLQSFVAMELRKQITWSRIQPGLFHFRTQTGVEVDLVLEDPAGRVVGIEVKAGATVRPDDLNGLRALSQALGDRFRRGVVLYMGSESVPFGPRLHALPLSALWELEGQPQQTS